MHADATALFWNLVSNQYFKNIQFIYSIIYPGMPVLLPCIPLLTRFSYYVYQCLFSVKGQLLPYKESPFTSQCVFVYTLSIIWHICSNENEVANIFVVSFANILIYSNKLWFKFLCQHHKFCLQFSGYHQHRMSCIHCNFMYVLMAKITAFLENRGSLFGSIQPLFL